MARQGCIREGVYGWPPAEVNVTMNYPLWNLFLTMLWLFVWIVLIFLVIRTILSIFRSHDLSGWGKAGWLALIILVPYIGVFAYLIVRGSQLAGEQVETANAPQDAAIRDYESWESRGKHGGDELTKLADLRDRGVITEAEFQRGKDKILG
jgi:hypothetical protein